MNYTINKIMTIILEVFDKFRGLMALATKISRLTTMIYCVVAKLSHQISIDKILKCTT